MTLSSRLFAGISSMMIFFACTSSKKETPAVDSVAVQVDSTNNYERFYDINAYAVTYEVTPEEIQIVDSTSAIVIYPTDEQIDLMLQENGEDFYTIADDNSFYQTEAIVELDSFAVKTILAKKRYLKLVGESQSWLLDIRLNGAPEWNIIFFDRKKTPKVVSAIDVDSDEILSFYGLDR
jgi:hypothetical protein